MTIVHFGALHLKILRMRNYVCACADRSVCALCLYL